MAMAGAMALDEYKSISDLKLNMEINTMDNKQNAGSCNTGNHEDIDDGNL